MDIYSRRIIGFAVQPISVDGSALCTMFARVIGSQISPQTHCSDNDALFQYHRRQATLRILNIDEIKSVPLGENISTIRCSGRPPIWSENLPNSPITTTHTAYTRVLPATLLMISPGKRRNQRFGGNNI